MHEQTIAIYCISEEAIRSFGLEDDPQCKMTTSEIMTFALFSATHYQCDYRKTRLVASIFRFFKNILSLSRLVRRIHGIPEAIWLFVFSALRMYFGKAKTEYFIVDSFPIKAYEFILSLKRNRIETTFSGIINKMPRYIRARTESGFHIKITLFIIAYVTERAISIV